MFERRSWRPQLASETALLLCGLFFAVFCNAAYWSNLLTGRGSGAGNLLFIAVQLLGLTAMSFLIFGLVTPRRLLKPVMTLMLVATACAVYFIERYRIYLDPTMLRNVVQTDPKEAGELISLGLFKAIFLYAVLPSAALWAVRLKPRSFLRGLSVRLAWLVAAVAVLAGSILLYYADLSSFHRNNREARYLITPANYMYSLGRALTSGARSEPVNRTPVGLDAKAIPPWAQRSKPPLVVFVLGETARAANFQLNGYARQTTPQLAARDVVNFTQVRSCGTATAVSLPCMFSKFGRSDYSDDAGLRFESVLQVLARAGLRVIWRDNQSGCKGVCSGQEFQDMSQLNVPGLCEKGRCFDEILLHEFDQLLANKQPTFLVLHQLGSHGPAYFARYPKEFARFVPECKEADLRLCSRESIVNAYDNTILYTDHLLAKVIDRLAARTDYDTAMIYVSDHGESLGENGLYLHGLPYAIAPDVQKHVPMVFWTSPGFQRNFGLDPACLKANAGKDYSHDNLFHSLLGLLSVESTVYNGTLDLFKPCRAPRM